MDAKEAFVKNIGVMHLVNNMKSNQDKYESLQAMHTLPFQPAGLARSEILFTERSDRSKLTFNSCGEFSITVSPLLPGHEVIVTFSRADGGSDETRVMVNLVSARAHCKFGAFGAVATMLWICGSCIAQMPCHRF